MRQNYFEDCLKKIEYSRQDGKIASAQAKELQLDVMNKTEQKRKLDQDFALGKIDAKLYNEWDANIRRDISGISNRVDFLGELHRKEERKKKSLAVIGVAAAIGGVCAFFAVPQYLHAHRTIAIWLRMILKAWWLRLTIMMVMARRLSIKRYREISA